MCLSSFSSQYCCVFLLATAGEGCKIIFLSKSESHYLIDPRDISYNKHAIVNYLWTIHDFLSFIVVRFFLNKMQATAAGAQWQIRFLSDPSCASAFQYLTSIYKPLSLSLTFNYAQITPTYFLSIVACK